MSAVKFLGFCICSISIAVSVISFSSLTPNELSDAELARVFGEGIPGTECDSQAACTVPNTCNPNSNCAGHAPCNGPNDRVCIYGGSTICTMTPLQTCCSPVNCILTVNPDGSVACTPNVGPGGAAVGARTNC